MNSMNIVLINGNMPHYDHGLGKVIKIIRDTLQELGVTTDEVNLGFIQLPFYDGIKAQATDDIIRRIREASGVIFACTAQLFAPTALMKTFLEYLELDEYNDVLREKYCFPVIASASGGERSALDYMSRVIQHMGGYEGVRIGLQEIHTRGLDTDAALREVIEKEAEDFYRAMRQRRRYIIPRDFAGRQSLVGLTGSDVAQLQPEKAKKDKIPVKEVYKRLNLDAFTDQQEQDIQELTRLVSAKYASPGQDDDDDAYKATALRPFQARPVVPREKTIRQITQSLPHYFQPQLSNGLSATIQLSITGAENFDGYLTIISTECEYKEGVAPTPDLTIIADCSVWQDVLKHKYTAQKAFMIGGLKVRGNFVLLTKFDTLFKLGAL